MLVVPVAIYLLTYIPYFSLGHGLSDWISLQANMYDYHAHLKAGHPYSSFWYEWPLARGAVYFYASANGVDRSEIWTIGNPVVFLGGLVGLVALTVSAWRRRDVAIGAIPWAVFGLMAPWVLVSRELFLYHYAPVVPFLAIALAWLISARSIGHRPSWIEIATVVGGAAFAFAADVPDARRMVRAAVLSGSGPRLDPLGLLSPDTLACEGAGSLVSPRRAERPQLRVRCLGSARGTRRARLWST